MKRRTQCKTGPFGGCTRSVVVAALLGVVGLPSPAQSDTARQEDSKAAADVAQLQRLTKWTKSDCSMNADPSATCGVGANPRYTRARFDHEVSGDDATANRAIADLDRRVVAYLTGHGWSVKQMGAHSGIPDMKRCYQKGDLVVQVFKTTGRCTMNSPCTAYDGFTVVTYTPTR